MLDRIVAAIALALLQWLDRRVSDGGTAEDAGGDRERMRRIGDRVRERLRETDRTGAE